MKIYRTVSTLTNWEEREGKGDPKVAIGKEYRLQCIKGDTCRRRLTENAESSIEMIMNAIGEYLLYSLG